ncbi:MAG TPA: 3-deoxy-D-manno-octulosonic acid transferase [Bacteroidales bacterium]|nr:3-deoxy-D-manno-octulosonic acid transferase [Bacteroidales bacterium]
MRLLYTLSIRLYIVAVHIASWFEPRAKKWLRGRKNLFSNLKSFAEGSQPLAWFHCASLGEFEQGRPVIEAFKNQNPHYRILLSFFSPSGFEVRKNYIHADHVCYLPADTPFNAHKFIDMVKPGLVVFVKYEYWLNFIDEITKRDVPLYVLSANFRPDQFFFMWYGKWFLKRLKKITRFFVQNRQSADLLAKHGINQVTISGDTRFDRVAAIANEKSGLPLIEAFIAGHDEVIVAGSTWQADETLLAKLFKENPGKFKLIMAPHQVHEAHIKALEELFPGLTVRYSELQQNMVVQRPVLIIDSIGMLSKLYRFGRYAYVGGGFGAGIHNVLEAAVYGIPVIFGPNHQKFTEALELIAGGGAFGIRDYNGLAKAFDHLASNSNWQQSARAARDHVNQRTGATEKVMEWIGVS